MIDPDVLKIPGTLVALGLAHSPQTQVLPISDAIGEIDLDILYAKWVWSADVQKRLQIAEKIEILVPRFVPINLLKKTKDAK